MSWSCCTLLLHDGGGEAGAGNAGHLAGGFVALNGDEARAGEGSNSGRLVGGGDASRAGMAGVGETGQGAADGAVGLDFTALNIMAPVAGAEAGMRALVRAGGAFVAVVFVVGDAGAVVYEDEAAVRGEAGEVEIGGKAARETEATDFFKKVEDVGVVGEADAIDDVRDAVDFDQDDPAVGDGQLGKVDGRAEDEVFDRAALAGWGEAAFKVDAVMDAGAAAAGDRDGRVGVVGSVHRGRSVGCQGVEEG